ncbi:formylglycine-generating enzyme family protein [Sphingomonas sp.]|uniref:formylglycine-generating enzyme family protein n=1 Tax=Sphingomonas sp. TaxID=28214 RepID=UPI0035BC7269
MKAVMTLGALLACVAGDASSAQDSTPATARAGGVPSLPVGAVQADRRSWADRYIDRGTFVETDMDADRVYLYDPASFRRLPDGHVVGLIRAELMRPRVVAGRAVRSVRKMAEIDCAALRYRERTVEGFAASNLTEPVPGLPVSGKWTDPATAGSPAGRRLFPACADVTAFAKDRTARFASVKAAQPPQEATNAEIKAKTAALVAAAGPIGAADRPPIVWRTSDKPALVFDVAVGPRMVVVPAGEFTMGRERVRLTRPLAVSMFPITYGEYSWFVAETRRPTIGSCVTLEGGRFNDRQVRDWYNPGFAQGGRSPATCVGYDDAVAYTTWLSRKAGHTYRLLTEAEYEFANRAGSGAAYWWGNDPAGACTRVNGFDQDARANAPALKPGGCGDGHAYTALLDTSKPNPFGLYDTTGNVASWTSDCWARRASATCRVRAVRGGSWASPPDALRADARAKGDTRKAAAWLGFRIAREL